MESLISLLIKTADKTVVTGEQNCIELFVQATFIALIYSKQQSTIHGTLYENMTINSFVSTIILLYVVSIFSTVSFISNVVKTIDDNINYCITYH